MIYAPGCQTTPHSDNVRTAAVVESVVTHYDSAHLKRDWLAVRPPAQKRIPHGRSAERTGRSGKAKRVKKCAFDNRGINKWTAKHGGYRYRRRYE